jgi:hypothetical protein
MERHIARLDGKETDDIAHAAVFLASGEGLFGGDDAMVHRREA